MSQKKVDKYKQQKANREKIMKREKLMHRLEMTAVAVVLIALVGWFGFSIYARAQQNKPAKEYVLDTNALDSYLNALTTDETAADDASTDETAADDIADDETAADDTSADEITTDDTAADDAAE